MRSGQAIGAGFNGASFLDFGGQNISSLITALLALGALCCYLLAVYMLPLASSPPQGTATVRFQAERSPSSVAMGPGRHGL